MCAEGIWCVVGRCVCMLRASGVMGKVCLCAEGSCRRVSGVMCTFRWLSEQKT